MDCGPYGAYGAPSPRSVRECRDARPGIPAGASIRAEIGPDIRSKEGSEVPGFSQEFRADLDPAAVVP